jgi:WD40 repeat protein
LYDRNQLIIFGYNRIVSVDISPEWPSKRLVLTGSADGTVKQWNLEGIHQLKKIKSTHSHEVHSLDKEVITNIILNQDFEV